MIEVIVSQFAEDDLIEITDYYYEMSPRFVDTLIADFEKTILSLQNYPKMGKIVPELERQGITHYRELIQGNYRIVYEVSEDKVIIHTIIDSRRNFQDVIIAKLSRYHN